MSDNPLLVQAGLPPFDKIKPEHVGPAAKSLVEQGTQLLAEAESAPLGDWDALKGPMGKLDLLFEYGWSPVGHLLGVANSDELRDAHEAALPEIITFSLALGQSKPLYERYCALRDSDSFSKMSSGQQRIVTKSILGSEQSGIGLEGEQLQRFNEIAQQLSQLGSDFSNNVLDATKAWHMDIEDGADAEGFPASLRRLTAASWAGAQEDEGAEADPDNGPWRITLDGPCFGPFMEHCRNRELREKAYRAYLTRASEGDFDNQPLIDQILQLRKEKCELLGYEHFASLSLSQKMADGVGQVQTMFDDLLDASLTAGKSELAELAEFAKDNGHEGDFVQWDVAFWAERLREERFSFTDEELRPYFSLEPVLEGLYSLCNKLFGITVKPADGKAPIWNADVRYFEVFGESGEQIAAFYLDPYSRPENKRPGAWMGDCIARSVSGDEIRLPVAHLVCNSTPPIGDTPSLMTFREVETLFHEFGHGLQHMLTTVDLRDVSGISGVEWDAVELPSQFMELSLIHI